MKEYIRPQAGTSEFEAEAPLLAASNQSFSEENDEFFL